MNPQMKLWTVLAVVAVTALLILIPLRAADLKSSETVKPSVAASEANAAMSTNLSPATRTVELLEVLRIWMLARDLELSKDQMTHFVPLFEELQRVKDRFREERRRASERLKAVDTADATEDEMVAALDAWQSVENKYWQEVQRLKSEMNAQLSPSQQVKFAIFNQTYPRKMRQLIASLKQVGEAKKPHIDQLLEEQK